MTVNPIKSNPFMTYTYPETKKWYKVLSQNLLKRSQHSCLKGKVLDSAPEMKILQGGAKSTEPPDDRSYLLVRIAIVLVSDRQRKEGEKSFKCNQCDFESVQAGNSRTFKLTLEKKRTNAINATLHLHRQAN